MNMCPHGQCLMFFFFFFVFFGESRKVGDIGLLLELCLLIFDMFIINTPEGFGCWMLDVGRCAM